MSELPDNVYSAGIGSESDEFAELIPRDSRVAQSSHANMRPSVSPQQAWNIKMSSADGVSNMELDIVSNPIHLLQLLERDIKKKYRISAERRVFTDYSIEVDGAKKVWSLLENVGVRNYDTLRRWTSWYAKNEYDKDANVACGLCDMSSSWNKFTEGSSDFVPDYLPQHDIVEHLDKMFFCCDRHQAVQEASLTYGFCIAYSYARVKYGLESVKMSFASLAGEMETLSSYNISVLRRRLQRMIAASLAHFYKPGTMSEEVPSFVSRMKALNEKAGIVVDTADYRPEETASQKNFWTFVESHS